MSMFSAIDHFLRYRVLLPSRGVVPRTTGVRVSLIPARAGDSMPGSPSLVNWKACCRTTHVQTQHIRSAVSKHLRQRPQQPFPPNLPPQKACTSARKIGNKKNSPNFREECLPELVPWRLILPSPAAQSLPAAPQPPPPRPCPTPCRIFRRRCPIFLSLPRTYGGDRRGTRPVVRHAVYRGVGVIVEHKQKPDMRKVREANQRRVTHDGRVEGHLRVTERGEGRWRGINNADLLRSGLLANG